MWQLLTREEPYLGLSQLQAATMVALDHERPPFPNGTPQPIRQLISDGWNENPKARPSFDIIVKRLLEMRELLTKHDRMWIEDRLGHPAYVPVKSKPKKPLQVTTSIQRNANKDPNLPPQINRVTSQVRQARTFFMKKKPKS